MELSHITRDSLELFFQGNSTGVLLLHGFTSTPQSIELWADYLAKAGYTVCCPLLPGHGTNWRAFNKTTWKDWYHAAEDGFHELQQTCDEVFVMGISMGGTLSLKLAEGYPEQVNGLVLVNPSITTLDKRAYLVPLLKWIVPSIKGIGSDIKKAGVREITYHRTPLKAFDSLQQLWRATRPELSKVSCPLLLYRSYEDHVVEPINARIILDGVSSRYKEERLCPDSYHVATLDNDAPMIFEGSNAFIADYTIHPHDSLPVLDSRLSASTTAIAKPVRPPS